MFKRSVAIGLLWPAFAVSLAFPQLQRLAIPATDISIDEHGRATIKTYCLDYGREGPKAGAEYGHLLSGEDSAVVVVDGKEMSLQNAIRDHLVELRTAAPTLAEFEQQNRAFELLGAGDPARSKFELDVLRRLTPDARKEILRKEENFSTIQVINLSGKRLQFKSKSAVLGAADEAVPNIASSSFSDPSVQTRAPIQGGVWLQLLQRELTTAGYSVADDGKLGPQTRQALESFQRSQSLPPTGRPNEETIKALHRAVDERNLQSLNTNGDFVVLRVENRPDDKERYRVIDGGNSVIYTGSDADQLIEKIVAAPVPKGTETKYLDLDGFTDKESENLSRSFRTHADQSIRPILRDEGITYDRDLVVNRGIRLETKNIDIVEETSGPRAGWFRAGLHFLVQIKEATRDVTMDIYSRSKDRLSEFVASFALNPGASGFDENASIAQLVSRGRKRLRDKYGSTGEFEVIIQRQTRFITVEVWFAHDQSGS